MKFNCPSSPKMIVSVAGNSFGHKCIHQTTQPIHTIPASLFTKHTNNSTLKPRIV
ncbi:hypothetical protein Sjap_019534 [Stephania japonica]|uniref:Uncharacterized protein n=1 Tax=Stephania japonica TaxID=461633 RepID=A0AAP0EYY9_9MAGN